MLLLVPAVNRRSALPRLGRARLLAVAALLALAGAARPSAPAAAQGGAARGTVSGRVLEQGQGSPVASAQVRLTAEDTHATVADTTSAEGRFSLPLPPGRGPFSLRAERLGFVALTVTVTAEDMAGGAAWRDLRLAVQAVRLPGLAVQHQKPARQRDPAGTPGGREERRLSWSATTTPVDAGDLAALAALQPGVYADDGGLSFFAQDPSQTQTTLDGSTYGATTLPQEALASTNVVTSAFDVSRGQYSGGMVEASTLAGTNLFGAALRTRVLPRALQWRPAAGPPGRPETSFAYAEGGAGGAIVYNRVFWYGAFSASRRSAPLVSLENAGPAVRAGWGVDPDSAARLAALLREGGAGPPGVSLPARALTEQGTGLLRLDWDVSDRHSLMLRLDGRHTGAWGLGVDPLATLASGGRARERAGGVMVQLTSQLGAVTHELRVYRSGESRRLEPEWAGPTGTVRVAAPGGSAAGSEVLSFGGSGTDTESSGSLLELRDEVALAPGAGHALKAGAVLSERSAGFAAAGNRYGTFSFTTLDAFRAGRPAAFTRTLGTHGGEARTRYGALYLGDAWQRGRLKVTFGARLEGRAYPASPAPDPAVEAAFGARPGRVPGEWGVSPRLGWTYDGAKWDLRGGAGEFRGTVPLPALAGLLAQTGAADQLSLWCVGPAAPTPDWEAYAADPGAVPQECAGGAGPFASRTPPLTVFAPDFAAPRTWHGAWGAVRQFARARLQLDASLTRGLGQPAARDANLAGTPGFALAAEGGRTVYTPPAAIDPGTGGVAPAASRRLAQWGTVRQAGAWGRSTVAQASARVSTFQPKLGMLLNVSYTHTRAWDRVGALSSPGGGAPLAGGDPSRLVAGPADRERRHDLQLQWMVMPRPGVRVGLLGRSISGAPFTPRVDGDVNGDGARNDAAFVFAPAVAGDPGLAAGMEALLADAPGRVRACLRRQLGRVAARNSCRTGWSSSLDLRADLQPWRKAFEKRLQLSLTTGNALGLADRLLHGSAGVRGWGEPAGADPVLLRVRGFDPAARAFRYEVNPAFGTLDAARARYRRSFTLTLEARVVVGSDPAYQPLQRKIAQSLGGGGRSAEELRLALSQRIPNLPAQVASLDSSLALGLSDAQRSRLRADAEAQGARLAPLADSLASLLSDLETRKRTDARAARREVEALTQRVQQVLDEELRALRALLTPDQWSRLPEAVRIPLRQLIPPRQFGRQ
ncbi:MAG TPA: carboxypeptidase regulatory-like domain-containing protein [Longimicrobium sp.]|nr:carboxypeptidase regulatory-like domain-containing protein [Longimicrobium sp.]